MSDVNDALSSLYVELPGEVAADVNGIVRNHIASLEAELSQLRTERDEALQREAENADKLKHYWLYSLPKLEAKFAELRAERDWLQQEQRTMLIECGKLRVLLLRADEALCMAIDIDDPNLSPSERDWIITQARGVHGDIRAALQEAEQ